MVIVVEVFFFDQMLDIVGAERLRVSIRVGDSEFGTDRRLYNCFFPVDDQFIALADIFHVVYSHWNSTNFTRWCINGFSKSLSVDSCKSL